MSFLHYAKTVGEGNHLFKYIEETTEILMAKGIKVKWYPHVICNSILIGDPEHNSGWLHIATNVPYSRSLHRHRFALSSQTQPTMPGPKPAHIFVLAEQFRAAGVLAVEVPRLANVLQVPQLYEARSLYLPTSYMVNSAFALELYFKCLIRIGGKSYGRAHDLTKLFSLIGRRNRARIKIYWRGRVADQAKTAITKIYVDNGQPVPKIDFDFCLGISKDAFTTMRYLYEGLPPQEGWAADGIGECARRVILEKHPTWIHLRQLSPVPTMVYNPHP